jgi:hypothetical protein
MGRLMECGRVTVRISGGLGTNYFSTRQRGACAARQPPIDDRSLSGVARERGSLRDRPRARPLVASACWADSWVGIVAFTGLPANEQRAFPVLVWYRPAPANKAPLFGVRPVCPESALPFAHSSPPSKLSV